MSADDANLAARHELRSRRPLPGASRAQGEWILGWHGTAVIGILNVTPDSFSDGGRHGGVADAVAAGRALAEAGARIVDVGGESTRPGAAPVGADEERRRVLPVIEALAGPDGPVISVDTRRAEVARDALAAGAHMVNDVAGLRDAAMRRVCGEAGVPVIVMHMQGEPRTMQDDPRYEDVVAEVEAFLHERAGEAEAEGVPSVVVDPGIGFGKTVPHNLALLRALPRLVALGRPVLVGASRKGVVGALGSEPAPERRDPGSIALHLDAARRGAALVRVHDVAGHVQALRVQEALLDHAGGAAARDRIVLSGMAFHGYHGVFEEEARFGARFEVDVELRTELPARDELSRTVDYARVYELVAERVTGRRYRLIEALANSIAQAILAAEARVAEVTVRVHKPHAPLPGVVRDVAIEVVRRR